MQADQDWDCTTSGRVAGAEWGYQQSTAEQSVGGQLSTVLLQHEQAQSEGRGRVQITQSVSFVYRVTRLTITIELARMAIERARSSLGKWLYFEWFGEKKVLFLIDFCIVYY